MSSLNGKVAAVGIPIGEILVIGKGMETGRNGVFGGIDPQTMRSWGVGEDLYYLRARNADFQRYRIINPEKLMVLHYDRWD